MYSRSIEIPLWLPVSIGSFVVHAFVCLTRSVSEVRFAAGRVLASVRTVLRYSGTGMVPVHLHIYRYGTGMVPGGVRYCTYST